MCIYIVTEYWPVHSFKIQISVLNEILTLFKGYNKDTRMNLSDAK